MHQKINVQDLQLEEHGAKVKFLQMKCTKCGKEWGIYLGNNRLEDIPPSNIICNNCTPIIIERMEILENDKPGYK